MSRLTWLSPGDPSQRTGGFLYNARMVEGLRELGLEVAVLELGGDWPWPAEVGQHDAKLASIASGTVVVADGLLWPGLAQATRDSLCARCTVWVVVHSLADKETSGLDGDGAARREVEALRGVYGWFATSKRTAAVISERLGSAHQAVIVPGTEHTSERCDGEPSALLSVGHLIPRKAHDDLLRTLAELKEYPWSLRIVGSLERDPDCAQRLLSLRDDLGLSGRVDFVGECGESALDAEYRRAGVLVHTAHFEAYGMVLTEALSRGLPVISTEAGALDERESDAVWVASRAELQPMLSRWFRDESARSVAKKAARCMTFPSWSEQVVALRALLGLAEHGFSTDWLRMREPFDHAARSVDLVERFGHALEARQPRLLELATGLGSGARFVADHFGRQLEWCLLDHDEVLLADLESEMRSQKPGLTYQTVRHDLQDVEGLPKDVDGVTTQALLDLVSRGWLERFAAWLIANKLPLLAAISVDGRMSWTVPDEADDLVRAAFRTHQTWDRGFGASPGVDAVPVLADLLGLAGFELKQTESDWVISAESTDMMKSMIDGISQAAMEAARAVGAAPSEVAQWRERRHEQLGRIGMRVGHIDLLAIPPRV